MKVNWLINGDMLKRYREQLVAEIRQLGHEARTIHALQPGR